MNEVKINVQEILDTLGKTMSEYIVKNAVLSSEIRSLHKMVNELTEEKNKLENELKNKENNVNE